MIRYFKVYRSKTEETDILWDYINIKTDEEFKYIRSIINVVTLCHRVEKRELANS